MTGVLTPVPDDWGVTRLAAEETTITPNPSLANATSAVPRQTGLVGRLAAGQAFGNRYHVIRTLGQGGMGCVYHAWDAELGVAVALKVIKPEIADDPYVAAEIERRFKRELLLARQVSHKNVVRIHDLGDIDGTKYITMSYIEGADLAAVLAREGKLPVARVMPLARQVAAGLQAAHEVGIVHRDLKPANVMIAANDQAQIMDFGIARSANIDSGMGTMAGTVVGTVEYMAPEQAQGQAVDQRADIYAFGLILYDLLLGSRPVPSGEGVIAALVARINSAPPPLRSIDPSIPEAVDALVMKCVQPDPAARFQTSTELVAALDRINDAGLVIPEKLVTRLPKLWLAAASVTIALLVASTTWLVTRSTASATAVTRDPVSVLIADFDNRAKDPVFDGLIENALGIGIEGAAFVTSFERGKAQAQNAQLRPGSKLDPEGARLIANREGIRVVLSGSIARDGDGYLVEVKALDTVPGTELVTARARAGDKAAVLDAVSRVAKQVREALGDSSGESERALANETFTAASLEAAREYALGQELFQQNKYEESVEHYRKALEHDPEFGRAYSAWAMAAALLGRTEESQELFNQALKRLDRMTEREKLRTLGVYYSRAARNYEKAIENYTALLAKYPADSIGLNNLTLAYFNTLNFQKALESGAKTVSLFPKSVLIRYNQALYAMYAGDVAEAAANANKALELNADTPKAYLALAMSAEVDGRGDEAMRVWERAANASPRGKSLAAIGRADLLLHDGRFGEAESLLTTAIADDRAAKNTLGVSTKLVALADAYFAEGRTADALRTIDEALRVSKAESVAVPAARLYLNAGRPRDAVALADHFSSQLVPRARAYGKLIEGMVALHAKRTPDALQSFGEALKLSDLWLVRYWRGIAYIEGGAYAEALSEIEACEKRRGEATAVFLDDVPTWRYTVPVKYWLARAQEGLKMTAQASANYRAFLALRPSSDKEALVVDARKRVAS